MVICLTFSCLKTLTVQYSKSLIPLSINSAKIIAYDGNADISCLGTIFSFYCNISPYT